MKRIFLFFFLCSMTVLTTFAQEKKLPIRWKMSFRAATIIST